MRNPLIFGAIGLILSSGVALADEYSSSTTTHSNGLNSSSTRVDKSSTNEDGMLTQRTNVYHSNNPTVPAPTAQSETTIQKKTTTTTDQ